MFTKPVNIPVPLTEIKQRPRKKWFNIYVLCFLFLILCIILVLAYRTEVKFIQQNLKKNYDDYVAEMKKELIDEENSVILIKNHYDTEQNGDDYEVINVQIVDDDQSFSKTTPISISSEKTTLGASINDDIATPQDSVEATSSASEITSLEENTKTDENSSTLDSSEEENVTTVTSTVKADEITTKLPEMSKPTEKTNQSTLPTAKSNYNSETTKITTKAIKIEDYITKSTKLNTTKENQNKTDEYYDPKKSEIVVIQIQQDTNYPDIDITPTTDKNKKYYHLPKDMFESNNDESKVTNNINSKTTLYQGDDVIQDSSEENIKKTTTEFMVENYNEEYDPPNENIDSFQSNVENINKIISSIHKEISKQIDKDLADMQKELPPLNVDLDFEVDPDRDRSKINI